MTTLELIEKIRRGADLRLSQEELYVRVRDQLLEKLSSRIPEKLSSRIDGEDVLHEAFLRALHSIDLYDSPREDGFYAWVFGIARNLLIDQLRRKSVGVQRFGGDGTDATGPRPSRMAAPGRRPESVLARRDWVESIFSRLRDEEAEVIRLHKYEGLSMAEIAEKWGKTPAAVQRFYSRSVHKFRALIEGEVEGGAE